MQAKTGSQARQCEAEVINIFVNLLNFFLVWNYLYCHHFVDLEIAKQVWCQVSDMRFEKLFGWNLLSTTAHQFPLNSQEHDRPNIISTDSVC